MSRAVSRSIQIGLLLILLGACFIYENVVGHASIWSVFWRYSPLLFIWVGINKAVFYFRYRPDAADEKAPSFSSTLIWIGCGVFLLVWTLGYVPNFFAYLGTWWPLFLILVGAGKLVDIFFPGRTGRLTGGEIIFMIFVLLAGLVAWQVARFDLSRLPPLLIEGREYRLKDLLHKSVQQTAEESFALEGATAVSLSHTHGDLELVPAEGDTIQVRLDTKVYADTDEQATEVARTVRMKPSREAGRLRLTLQTPDSGATSVEVRIRLAVPPDVPLEFENSFGGITATDLRNPASLTARNGAIRVRGHHGTLRLANRYDKISVEDSEGETEIRGLDTDIRVINLKGPLTLDNKNGEIELADIEGKTAMTVRYVTVNGEQLNGDFQLTGKNATLTLNTVAGNVNLENSDDEIELTDIKGGIDFKLRACSLTAKEIGGAIAGTAASGAVVIKDAAGPATLTLEKTRCRIERIAGKLTITNSLKDVSITGAEADVTCSNKNASITLRSLPPAGKARVRATAERGDILLVLPGFPESYRLFLSADNGKITSGFRTPPIKPSSSDRTMVWKNFSGAPDLADVQCKAAYGNIRLKPGEPAEESE